MEPSDVRPLPEPLGDIAMQERKARERAKMKGDYERWRAEPFTELFLSYFQALAEAHKDLCVREDTANRDAHAHYHQAYKRVAVLADEIYQSADANIERRYYHEMQERNREVYGAGGEWGTVDMQGGRDGGERGSGF